MTACPGGRLPFASGYQPLEGCAFQHFDQRLSIFRGPQAHCQCRTLRRNLWREREFDSWQIICCPLTESRQLVRPVARKGIAIFEAHHDYPIRSPSTPAHWQCAGAGLRCLAWFILLTPLLPSQVAAPGHQPIFRLTEKRSLSAEDNEHLIGSQPKECEDE
jgi:hypothetical protein